MGSEVNSVVIVGERVDLTDGSSRNLKPVTVNFTEYYVPSDISEEDKPRLKDLFRDVFTKSIETSLPCNLKDKALIKKSLQFRAGLLRNELLTISKNKDYVQPRETIDHFKKLKTLLDRFDLLPCIDSVEISGEVGDLDDNKIDKLLKEFIFVLLQAHMPIDAYKDKTAYAQDIVRRLLKDPVDFDKVLEVFKGKIPTKLQNLLTCMNSVTPSQIELIIKERMKELTVSIIEKIKRGNIIPPDSIWWKGVDENDIDSIVDHLILKIQALEDELKEKEKELGALHTSDKAVTDLGLKELPARIQALEKEVAALRAKIEALEAAAKESGEVKRLKEALEAAQKKNEELQGHITRLEGELNALRASGSGSGSGPGPDIAALEKRATDAEAAAAAAKAAAAKAKAEAAAAKAAAEAAAAAERAKAAAGAGAGAAAGSPDVAAAKAAADAAAAKAAAAAAEAAKAAAEAKAARDAAAAAAAAAAGNPQALQDLQRKMKELEATIATLNSQLAEQKAAALVTLTPEEIAQLMAQLEEQNQLLAEQERLLGLLKEKLTAAEQRTQGNPALAAENEKLREALGKLQASENSLLVHITTLERQLLELKGAHKTELEALQAKNAELLAEITKLSEQIKGLGGAPGSGSGSGPGSGPGSGSASGTKGESLGTGNTNESTLQDLQEKLARLQGQLDEMTQQMEALKANHAVEIAEKIKEIDRLRAENDGYKKSIQELQKLNGEIKAELDTLKAQLATKEAALASLKSGATLSEAQLATIRGDMAGLLEEIKSLKEQIELLTQEYEAAKATLNEVEGDYQAIMDMVEGLDTDVDAIQAELAALRKRCPEGLAKVNAATGTGNGVNTGGTAEDKAKANLFKYLIGKTQDLIREGLKLNEAGLNESAIDAFIKAIKENEVALNGCHEQGVKAKAAIDKVTTELNDIRAKAAASGSEKALEQKAKADAADAAKAEAEAAKVAAEAAKEEAKAAIAAAEAARAAADAAAEADKQAAQDRAVAAETRAKAAETKAEEAEARAKAAEEARDKAVGEAAASEAGKASQGIELAEALAKLAAAQKALTNQKGASNTEKADLKAAQDTAIQAATAAAAAAKAELEAARREANEAKGVANASRGNSATAVARAEAAEARAAAAEAAAGESSRGKEAANKARAEANAAKAALTANANARVATALAKADAAEAKAAAAEAAVGASSREKEEANKARAEANAARVAAETKVEEAVAAADAKVTAAEAAAAAAEAAKVAIEAAANDNATAKEQAIARAVAAEAEAARVIAEHTAAIAAAEASGREKAADAARARAEAAAAAASLTSLQGSGAEKDQRLAAAEAAVVAAQASQAAAEQQAAASRAEAEAAKKNAAASKDEETRVKAKITEAYAKFTEAGRKEASAAAVMADANIKVEKAGKSEDEARAATAAAAAEKEAARAATEAAAVKEKAANGLIEEAARISADTQLAVTAAQEKRDDAVRAKTAAEQQAAAFKEAAAKALEEKEAALASAKEAQAKSAIFEAQLLDTAAQIDASIEAQTGLQGANAELQKQLEECRNKLRECLESSTKNKTDIAAIIKALGSNDVFDPEVKDEDAKELKGAITKLLQDFDKETTSNAVIVKLATSLKDGRIPSLEDLNITQDSSLAQLIEAIRAFKMPPVAKEQELNQLCYLLFFSSHIISTHFPKKNEIQILFEGILDKLMSPTAGTTKYSSISLIIDFIMPLLNYMEQIYQSTDNGDFEFIIKEEFWGRDILQIIQGNITIELRNQINDLFLTKTGNRTINDVFITIGEGKGEDKKFNIIKFYDSKAIIKKPEITGNYSQIANTLRDSMPNVKGATTEKNNTHKISYPILFYFFMFAFKTFIKNRPGIIANSKCRLPKILQA